MFGTPALAAAPASVHAADHAHASVSDVSTAKFELRVPVLYYHRILCPPADATIPSLYECPDQFMAQLSYLKDNGWQAITVDQVADMVANRQCPPPKQFVISIDDGAVDGYDNAAPIMENLGMRGSFFVTSGVPGGLRPGKIDWDQLRDLVARGHAIGNHTETHQNLKVQPPDVIETEIEGAQQIFDDQLGFRPRTFAYPYGRYNDSAIAQVAASGFELAFTVHAGAREATDTPFTSKRIEVLSNDTGADVLAKIQPFANGCQPATPDVSLSLLSAGPFKGDGIYRASPSRTQTIQRTGVRAGKTYRYWVRLDNDAQKAGAFKVASTVDGTAGMTVSYRVNGNDVTAAVAAGTYTSPVVDPWTSITIVVKVVPTHPGTAAASTVVVLRATGVGDPTRIDVGRIVTAY